MPRSASETLGFIKPELPTLIPEPPTGEGWIHEIKYDGYRTFAFDLLHLDGQDLRWRPLMERRELLRRLVEPDPRSPIQFSDHVESDGARFFKAAAELGLEGIVSKRAASRLRGWGL